MDYYQHHSLRKILYCELLHLYKLHILRKFAIGHNQMFARNIPLVFAIERVCYQDIVTEANLRHTGNAFLNDKPAAFSASL